MRFTPLLLLLGGCSQIPAEQGGPIAWAIMGTMMLVVCLLLMIPRGSSRYPEGKCYLCRQGNAMPGETCPKCDTEQP